ncbi:unnamed protein product [Prunus armeniaca]|uniref:hAT-like transposase RNase-H fold domain-containing protein n=1 Tax=Prunus armeniaca TaxID=36596 RepID=A0A6J5VUK4_PRUAR|nr:unnamed protein product [Prunus armeniaca]
MTNGYGCVAEYVINHIQETKELCFNGQLFCGFRVYSCGEMVSEMVQDAFGKIIDIINKVHGLSSSVKSLPLWWNHKIFDLQQGSMYEVSNALFETKHPTPNVYLYHLHELHEILTKMSTDSDSFIRTIAEDMLNKFVKYWDNMFLLLAIAAVLDP